MPALPPDTALETFHGPHIPPAVLESAAELFSANYGVWSTLAPPPARAGQRVRMSASRLRRMCLPASDSARTTLVRILVADRVAGHACATRWMHAGRRVCWVTQLCVEAAHRRRGLATALLRSLCEEGKGEDAWFGILSSHAGAVLATLRAFGRGVEGVDTEWWVAARENWRAIMATSPVEYVRTAVARGSVFEDGVDENAENGIVSVADTRFFVDHAEVRLALNTVEERGAHWPYGRLPQGHEFLMVIDNRRMS